MDEYLSGALLLDQGYYLCLDDDIVKKVWAEYAETHIALTDKDGKHHLFHRRGNDWFVYVREL